MKAFCSFLFLVATAYSQSNFILEVPNGVRNIPPFSEDNTDYSEFENAELVYGYLILNQRLSAEKRTEVETMGNVLVVDPLKKIKDKWVYIAKTSNLALPVIV